MMKNKIATASAMLMLAGSSMSVLANVVNLTVPDFNGPLGAPINSGSNYEFNGGGSSAYRYEDNEVEQRPGDAGGVLRDQRWDLEAITLDTSSPKLNIIGGYNFTGKGDYYNQNSLYADSSRPGDILIKIGGPTPGTGPTTSTDPMANSIFGYNYAIHLKSDDQGNITGANLMKLSDSTTLNSILNPELGSNPWNVADDIDSIAINASRTFVMTGEEVSTAVGSPGLFDGLLDNANDPSGHYILSLDLSSIADEIGSNPLDISFTMHCGNDSIKGHSDNGFNVPDGGMTLALLGTGLSGLSLLRRRFAK